MICQTLCRAPAPATALSAARFLSHSPISRRLTLRRSSSSSSITMSSSQYIEHVVLFNVKDEASASQIDAMVTNLSSLRSLDVVLHLTAGPIHRLRSPPPPRFTHLLHSRYRSKEDLATYSAHPDHVGVVRQHVLPIVDDLLAVDWVSNDLSGAVSVPPGAALRLQFVKLKEEAGEGAKGEVLGVIGGLKEKIGGGVVDEVSFGENFSPGRAKGFSICSIGVFPNLDALEKLEGNEEIEKEKEKVRDYIDGLIVADYVLPPSQSASL